MDIGTQHLIQNIQHTYALGAMGEYIAREYLIGQGYDVSIPCDDKSGDLLASKGDQSFLIEVKTARRDKRGRWNYQLFKCDRYGSTNHLNSDIVLLLAITKISVFFYAIPTKILRKKSKIAITSFPTEYHGYLNKYQVINSLELRA